MSTHSNGNNRQKQCSHQENPQKQWKKRSNVSNFTYLSRLCSVSCQGRHKRWGRFSTCRNTGKSPWSWADEFGIHKIQETRWIVNLDWGISSEIFQWASNWHTGQSSAESLNSVSTNYINQAQDYWPRKCKERRGSMCHPQKERRKKDFFEGAARDTES